MATDESVHMDTCNQRLLYCGMDRNGEVIFLKLCTVASSKKDIHWKMSFILDKDSGQPILVVTVESQSCNTFPHQPTLRFRLLHPKLLFIPHSSIHYAATKSTHTRLFNPRWLITISRFIEEKCVSWMNLH